MSMSKRFFFFIHETTYRDERKKNLKSEADFLQRKPQDLTIEERQDKMDQINRKGLERN